MKVRQTISNCCSELIDAFDNGFFSLRFNCNWGKPELLIKGKRITESVYNVQAITYCPFCGERL